LSESKDPFLQRSALLDFVRLGNYHENIRVKIRREDGAISGMVKLMVEGDPDTHILAYNALLYLVYPEERRYFEDAEALAEVAEYVDLARDLFDERGTMCGLVKRLIEQKQVEVAAKRYESLSSLLYFFLGFLLYEYFLRPDRTYAFSENFWLRFKEAMLGDSKF
jgi:hypothetical protein